MAGGDGSAVCPVEILLQSLVSCAGVTMAAVSCALEIRLQSARICAFGTMAFRGTLGVSRDAPVGLSEIQLEFHLETHEPTASIQKLLELTERYCVVFQTLKSSVPVVVTPFHTHS